MFSIFIYVQSAEMQIKWQKLFFSILTELFQLCSICWMKNRITMERVNKLYIFGNNNEWNEVVCVGRISICTVYYVDEEQSLGMERRFELRFWRLFLLLWVLLTEYFPLPSPANFPKNLLISNNLIVRLPHFPPRYF